MKQQNQPGKPGQEELKQDNDLQQRGEQDSNLSQTSYLQEEEQQSEDEDLDFEGTGSDGGSAGDGAAA